MKLTDCDNNYILSVLKNLFLMDFYSLEMFLKVDKLERQFITS